MRANDDHDYELRANNGPFQTKSPYERIAQLSRLSIRLFEIYHCKATELTFAALHSAQTPIFDDACYRIVAGWFVYLFAKMQLQLSPDRESPMNGSSSSSEVFNAVFSASHCLLDFLRVLQREGSALVSFGGDSRAGARPGLVPFGQIDNEHIVAFFLQTSTAARHSNSTNDCLNTVIRHLVITCHIQILNIYVTILIALQHDANLKKSHIPTDEHVEDDTRLAVVVQLCAYLLKRQRQAVSLFLSQTPSTPTFSAECATASAMDNRALMGHLEVAVQQRLARVQQILRI